MDLSHYESVKEAFERVFFLVSKHEKKQNSELLEQKHRLRNTLQALRQKLRGNAVLETDYDPFRDRMMDALKEYANDKL